MLMPSGSIGVAGFVRELANLILSTHRTFRPASFVRGLGQSRRICVCSSPQWRRWRGADRMNRLGVAFPRNGSMTIRMSMMKKETLNFRVSADFKRKLAEEAKKERRSLTNYLETALTKFWEQQESRVERKGEGGRT